MHKTLRSYHCFFLVFALPWLSGCSGNAIIQGKVTYEGKPIPNGRITFVPPDERGAVVGASILNGEYTAKDVPAGKKKVAILAEGPPGPIPNEATRDLSADVVAGTQTLNFLLEKSKPPSQ